MDLSWPWGLVTLGLAPLLTSATPWSGLEARRLLVCGAYVAAGLRMGLGAVMLAARGHLARELPRSVC